MKVKFSLSFWLYNCPLLSLHSPLSEWKVVVPSVMWLVSFSRQKIWWGVFGQISLRCWPCYTIYCVVTPLNWNWYKELTAMNDIVIAKKRKKNGKLLTKIKLKYKILLIRDAREGSIILFIFYYTKETKQQWTKYFGYD